MICSLFTLRVIREPCYLLETIQQVKSLLLCSLTRKLSILSQRSDSLHLLSLFGLQKTSPVLWTTPKFLLQRNFWNAPCRSATITRKPMCILSCILCCMRYIRHSDWSDQTRPEEMTLDKSKSSDPITLKVTIPNQIVAPCHVPVHGHCWRHSWVMQSTSTLQAPTRAREYWLNSVSLLSLVDCLLGILECCASQAAFTLQ